MDNSIEEKVNILKGLTDEDEIVVILQQIGEKLINEYYIEVDGIKIEPLWVEAYYYNQKTFPDCNTHLSDKQKDRFNQLYFHEKGRGGFDVVLSNSKDYYLSFLIKYYLINEFFYTQTGYKKLNLDIQKIIQSQSKEFLKPYKPEDCKKFSIEFAKRINLEKPCYKEEKLAAFPIEALSRYDFSSARSSIAEIAVDYMRLYLNNPEINKKAFKDKCSKVFGWCPDVVDKLWKENE